MKLVQERLQSFDKTLRIFFGILAAICCQYPFFSNAQGMNNLFMYGYSLSGRGVVDFVIGSPVVQIDSTRPINLSLTNANITDSIGNLLFYTNGIKIIDHSDSVMHNGDSLNPSPITTSFQSLGLPIVQNDIILQKPGSSNLFYLFHETIDNGALETYEIYYSVIDMNLNGGLGGVIQKNTIFLQDTLARGQVTACKHANGRDWWLIVPEYSHPAYYVFMVTPDTIQLCSKQIIGNRTYEGQAAFSPDGSHYGMYDMQTDIEIFDFDRCTGVFNNYRYVAINDSNFGVGFSFSPNSQLAYASSAHHLYQVNLDSSDLASSLITVADWDSTYDPFPPIETGFQLQLIAPDNKIYITTTGTTQFYHKINHPDSSGVACNVIQHSLQLIGYNDSSIPNHPNYFLGPVVGSVCDSLGLGVNDNVYKENLKLRVNPNPVTNSFYVNYELPTGKDAMLYVYNPVGILIEKQKIYSGSRYIQIHCNAWQQGLYYLKVVVEKSNFVATAKVMVIKD
jgi:hypothetical protein